MGTLESRLLCLLTFILCLHCVGLYFFTGGFLLTRTELPSVSTCADAAENIECDLHMGWAGSDEESCPVDECCSDDGFDETSSAGHQCWTKPLAKRLVILIIDALRYDFVAPTGNSTDEAAPWTNNLDILQKLLGTEGVPAKLFKFVADPPTTTLQRLKGLTTGGLPTFMDIGDSFGAPAVVEDNLLLQLMQMGKRAIMMGDDTWMQLFPKHFQEAYPFPSFNVKDLHTVDDGVIKEIFPALQRSNWDVLIAHFLGVDHVGHIFGVESPLMVEKLKQYNEVIKNIFSLLLKESHPGGLHENTVFTIMGDHGQTRNGDHGGGTAEEVETALFALTTRGLSQQVDLSFLSSDMPKRESITTFPQLDFAATIAAIMGIPIPFGSVGQVNPILWSLAAGANFSSQSEGCQKDSKSRRNLNEYSQALCLNSWQVKRYLESYSAQALTGFPINDLLKLRELYVASRAPVHKQLVLPEEERITAFSAFLSAAAALARSQWTQFHVEWMSMGIGVLLASLAVQSVALYRVRELSSTTENRCTELFFPVKNVILRSLLYTSLSASGMVVVLNMIRGNAIVDFTLDGQLKAMVPGLWALVAALVFLLSRGGTTAPKKLVSMKFMNSGWALTIRTASVGFFVFLHACSLFSNSFIVSEWNVISFFLASTGVLYLRQSLQDRSKFLKAISFLLSNFSLIAVGLMGTLKGTTVANSILSYFDVWKHLARVLLWTSGPACLVLFILTVVIRRLGVYYQSKSRGTWLVLGVVAPASYALVALYWLITDVTGSLSSVDGGDGSLLAESVNEMARLQLPRMVFWISGVITLYTMLKSLTKSTVDHRVLLEGVHEAVTTLLVGWSGTLMLLIGKKGPAIILLACLQAWCLREMHRGHLGSQTNPPATMMVDWNFIAVHLFFCTGHRCTFDGLNYTAAFMGFNEFNFFRQGVLLALDTFGTSHLLPVMAIPLLIVDDKLHREKFDPDRNTNFLLKTAKLYLSYGLIQSISATASVLCAALQRRHLMVWGLFAPKYVFDGVGLIVTDVCILLGALVVVSCKPMNASCKSVKD